MSGRPDSLVWTRLPALVCARCAHTGGLLGWLEAALPPLPFAMCFSAAEERPGGILALPNGFLKTIVAKRYGDALNRYAKSVGLERIEIVVDPTVSAPAADEQPPDEPVEARPAQMREQPPGLTTRLFAERGFWQLSPLGAGRTRQLDDLRGQLRVEAGAQGACGTYEAMVLSGLLAVWGDGPRAEPTVECGLRRLSGVLGLAYGGRTATQLRTAIERLKTTTYRANVSREDGGRERLFSLLDEIETTWVGPPTTIHRRIRAVFSRTTWDVISEPRILRTVDLAVLRTLGPRRELARRLFYLLEAQPGHELSHGVEVIERLVDTRLLASLGTQRQVWKVAQELRIAGSAITTAAPRYRSVELVPRRKRSIGPGEARWLLHVVRVRETKNERKHR
jgi:Replication initiator protein A